MRRARRWVLGLAALIALASCVEPSGPPPQSIPAPVTVTTPPPPAPRMPPVPLGDFTFKGSMIQGGLVIGTAPAATARVRFNGDDVPVAPDGRFIIAFDRDAGPTATVTATMDDGRTVSRTLTINPREWNISRLSTLPKYPVPMPEFEKLRPAEIEAINAVERDMKAAFGEIRWSFFEPDVAD